MYRMHTGVIQAIYLAAIAIAMLGLVWLMGSTVDVLFGM